MSAMGAGGSRSDGVTGDLSLGDLLSSYLHI